MKFNEEQKKEFKEMKIKNATRINFQFVIEEMIS